MMVAYGLFNLALATALSFLHYSTLRPNHARAWSHHQSSSVYRKNAFRGNNRLKLNPERINDDHFRLYQSIAFQPESDPSADSDALAPSIPRLEDNAPSWDVLREQVLATPTGRRLQRESAERERGRGPPRVDAKLRLFDADSESEARVTFYRDHAAWCPYCQKVWLLLEEKRIPYRVETVPLNAYGDKPARYTRLVDGGKLPALELDGELHLESMQIMRALDDEFSDRGPRMFPPDDARRIDLLLDLERELQRDWFSLVFYPVEGERLRSARDALLRTLRRVDDELGGTPGPWFLGGDAPSAVDLQYVATVERTVASALYWKGIALRGGRFANVDGWLAALERRPSYAASKSDYYTLAMAMPSQNGPGYFAKMEEANEASSRIHGFDDAWRLPLNLTDDPTSFEPIPSSQFRRGDDLECRLEAAFRLLLNREAIVRFACRGAGEPGRPSYHAELADPYAEPNEDFLVPVDACLRHVANALANGIDVAAEAAAADLEGKGGSGELREGWESHVDEGTGRTYFWNCDTGDVSWSAPTRQLDSCLAYLRDRIGVPRDMNLPAAMQLRAHLNWCIDLTK